MDRRELIPTLLQRRLALISPRCSTFLCTLLVLLAFGLRAYRLGHQEFWGDEAASFSFANERLTTLLRELATVEPHPPLYYTTLHFWMGLAGKSHFSLRFPSLVFGVLTVPLVYVLGKRLSDTHLGVLAAALTAVHPFQVWYSQEVRMYTMAAAFSLLSVVLFLRLMKHPRKALVVGYVVACVLAIASHYYAVFVLIAQNLAFLWSRKYRERSVLRAWLVAQGAVGLLYLPWVLVAWPIFMVYQKVPPGSVDLWAVFEGFWLRSAVGWTLDTTMARWAALMLAPILLLGLWQLRRQRAALVPLLYTLVPMTLGLLLSIRRPAYTERYLFITTPAFLLLLASGLLTGRRLWWMGATFGLIILGFSGLSLSNLYFNEAYAKVKYSPLTDQIYALAQPNDAVILNGVSQTILYEYYYRRELPLFILPAATWEQTQRVLEGLRGRYPGVWLLMAGVADYDPQGTVRNWLGTYYYRVSCSWATAGMGCYYRIPSSPAPSPTPVNEVFGDGIVLKSFGLDQGKVAAGDTFGVELVWQATKPVPERHKVFLHLRDEQGNLWGQNDSEPQSGVAPTIQWPPGQEIIDRHGLRVEPGTPPGTYTLAVGLYAAAGGQRLQQADGQTELVLDQIQVTSAPREYPEEAFRPATTVKIWVNEEVELLGYSVGTPFQAGQPSQLRAYWRALQPGVSDYRVGLRLVSKGGQVSELAPDFPLSPYSGARWQRGEVIGSVYRFTPAAELTSGSYTLLMQVTQEDSGRQASFPLRGLITVQVRERSYRIPKLEHPLNADFGALARLLGYELDQQAYRPGDTMRLTLFWQALNRRHVSYTVFTHLLDQEGKVVAQHDGLPAEGKAPTTSWLPNEVVTDTHAMALGSNLPPGSYRLEVGLYDAATGVRLSTDGKDHVLLPPIPVKTP